jgi:hypothetical protein
LGSLLRDPQGNIDECWKDLFTDYGGLNVRENLLDSGIKLPPGISLVDKFNAHEQLMRLQSAILCDKIIYSTQMNKRNSQTGNKISSFEWKLDKKTKEKIALQILSMLPIFPKTNYKEEEEGK